MFVGCFPPEQEIMDVLHDNAENNTLLKRDTVFAHLNFRLESGTMKLLSSGATPSNTGSCADHYIRLFLFSLQFLLIFFLPFLYTFSSCSSHIVKKNSSKFLHPEVGWQCCKCTLTEPPAPKMHVLTPSTANAFLGSQHSRLYAFPLVSVL